MSLWGAKIKMLLGLHTDHTYINKMRAYNNH